jgi:predicted transcriptional regulator
MEIITTPYKVIDPDDDLMRAWELIRDGAQLLIVVKNGIVYGIVTPSTIAMRIGEYTDCVVKGLLGNAMSYK